MIEWPEQIAAWQDAGIPVAIATVVDGTGSIPRSVGARMAVNANGDMAGSVSGGCVENAVVGECLDAIESGRPRLIHYGISDDTAWDVGLACGGQIDVFVEPLTSETAARFDDAGARTLEILQLTGEAAGQRWTWPREKLPCDLGDACSAALGEGTARTVTQDGERFFLEPLVAPRQMILFGAAHVTQALCHMASLLGFEVTVVDARPALLTKERFPDATRLIRAWPDDAFPQLAIEPSTVIAILSHDPKLDEPATRGALESPAGYIGAIGSRTTIADRRERLLAAGVSEEALDRLHAPIGLDLGGASPHEVAISIRAEVIAESNGRSGGPLRNATGGIRGRRT